MICNLLNIATKSLSQLFSRSTKKKNNKIVPYSIAHSNFIELRSAVQITTDERIQQIIEKSKRVFPKTIPEFSLANPIHEVPTRNTIAKEIKTVTELSTISPRSTTKYFKSATEQAKKERPLNFFKI